MESKMLRQVCQFNTRTDLGCVKNAVCTAQTKSAWFIKMALRVPESPEIGLLEALPHPADGNRHFRGPEPTPARSMSNFYSPSRKANFDHGPREMESVFTTESVLFLDRLTIGRGPQSRLIRGMGKGFRRRIIYLLGSFASTMLQ